MIKNLFTEKDNNFPKCYFDDIKCDNLEFDSLTSNFTLAEDDEATDVLVRDDVGEIAYRNIALPAYFSVWPNNLSSCPTGGTAVELQNIRYSKNVSIGVFDIFLQKGVYKVSCVFEVQNDTGNTCEYDFTITNVQGTYFRTFSTGDVTPGDFSTIIIEDIYDVGVDSDIFLRSTRTNGTGELIFTETSSKFSFCAFRIDN